jgi:tubulin polyglutamylase TTLL1
MEKESFKIPSNIHSYPNARIKLRWKTDLNKPVITENYIERGWTETNEEDDWNIYWACVNTVRNLFNAKTFTKLTDLQIVNHFPTYYELCRKDQMAKNIKKYKKALIKEGKNVDYLDFLPLTFVLPGDMSIFIEEFKKAPNSIWILKPSNKSQGQGIILVNKLNKIKKLNFQSKTLTENNTTVTINETYVISKYLEDPLLVSHKKFDMRIYVLVTSFHPLKVWLYRQGFCRFSNEKYSIDVNEIDNIFIHLTNVAIQKKYEKYNSSHGGKWSLKNLKMYLEMNYGYDISEKCFNDIKNVIISSLKAVQGVMHSDKHCYECYGYDIILDSNLKPWLIEINASPSLSTTTQGDYILKKQLINDIVNIVITDKWIDEKGRPGTNTSTKTSEGDFDVIFDESLTMIKLKKDSKIGKIGTSLVNMGLRESKDASLNNLTQSSNNLIGMKK